MTKTEAIDLLGRALTMKTHQAVAGFERCVAHPWHERDEELFREVVHAILIAMCPNSPGDEVTNEDLNEICGG